VAFRGIRISWVFPAKMFKIFSKIKDTPNNSLDPKNIDGYDLIYEETNNKASESILYVPGIEITNLRILMIEYPDELVKGKKYFGVRNVELYGSDSEVYFTTCTYDGSKVK